MTEQEDEPTLSLEEQLKNLAGSDPTLAYMLKMKRPLNLRTYLAMAYPDGTANLDAELVSMIPKPLLQTAQEGDLPEHMDPKLGALRVARFQHQNAQYRRKS